MGAERDVSLVTGQGFKKALIELGYPFEIIDAQADLPERLYRAQGDVALLALHGKYAEDGIVQSLCEYIKLPYTGSGVLSSALCMDKILTKQLVSQQNILTADFEVLDVKSHAKAVPVKLKPPFVVKPSREGSSVGISIVKNESEVTEAIKLAAKYDQYVLVEDYIDGVELTVPILGEKALTPIEIEPKVDFYSYENKYTSGKTEYFLPARVSEQKLRALKDLALEIFRICRMRSYGRVDFRMNKKGEVFLLEVNTLPGCTPTSLLPKSAQHEGISFPELVNTLVESARLDYDGVV